MTDAQFEETTDALKTLIKGSPFDALVVALVLAVETQTEMDSERSTELARAFAMNLSQDDIRRARAECLRILARRVH